MIVRFHVKDNTGSNDVKTLISICSDFFMLLTETSLDPDLRQILHLLGLEPIVPLSAAV